MLDCTELGREHGRETALLGIEESVMGAALSRAFCLPRIRETPGDLRQKWRDINLFFNFKARQPPDSFDTW